MKGLGLAVVIIIIIVVIVLIFSGNKQETPSGITEGALASVTLSVVNDLKSSGLVSLNAEIDVKKVLSKEWPDACLGIDEVDTLCAEVITPGFEITLRAEDRTFTYRTNEDGSFVVLAEQK